jgi:hypothetical protein
VALALCLAAQLFAWAPQGADGSGPTVVWDDDHTVDGIESYEC